MIRNYIIIFYLLLLGAVFAQNQKPNIVLIMCDDMGYSDLGSYGGEVQTPHIDSLAKDGVKFSNFKNTGRCCPSRASLLTGRHQHAVGLGWMTAVDEHRPGYRGQITHKIPTIAEVLKAKGYSTYMSGKWHVTVDGAWKPKGSQANGSYPRQRGFDEFYGTMSGGGNFYKPKSLYRNEQLITTYEKDYYYTDAITENALDFIKNHDFQKSFFLYLAHYAPHRPLQAPKKRVDQCRERYEVGYDKLLEERFNRLKDLGLLKQTEQMPLQISEYKGKKRPSWDSLSDELKESWVKEMATYAAMIEIMDDGIGEIIQELKSRGDFENTCFIFLSDNGATNEGGQISQLAADLSNTPFRSYKARTFMGGISSPLIFHYPKMKNKGIRTGQAHIIDMLPTCLDVAGIEYPKEFRKETIAPLDGISLLPLIKNEAWPQRDFFFEHQTSCAIISNGWKLVRMSSTRDWELYNLKEDPFEQINSAKNNPEKVMSLEKKWQEWGEKNNVLPLNPKGLSWNERVKKYTELNSDQHGRD
ncbi:arylsulfatase [Lentisphaera araneosa HTCC2155]|uniref:Arylsulfatase n=1 Tax=Lentisphaera araneosa HTCC2155 TaxID=313628 RepID=A6DJ87_9BACT|nr:arylsulfatase [Lentisphaera araneosa]EDM28523.1 arylsulfatase [Lentisphaera araneosa HTCC2155]